MQEHIGTVLSGGGGRGIAHIGVPPYRRGFAESNAGTPWHTLPQLPHGPRR